MDVQLVLEAKSRLEAAPLLSTGTKQGYIDAYWSHLASEAQSDETGDWAWNVGFSLLNFFADRLKVALKDQGKRGDLVDAVFALGDDDLVRIVSRVEALTTFLATEDGTNLLQGYKRAANILKAEEKKGPLPSGEPSRVAEPAEEGALFDALAALGPKLDAALTAEDFTGAMTALAALRAPVDAFFVGVLVNSDVAAERDNRLRLLQQVQSAMGRVADFSLVTG
jgi:glycyl-tRNA synthetase beta chain